MMLGSRANGRWAERMGGGMVWAAALSVLLGVGRWARGDVAVTYRLLREGNVSAAIYDGKGRMIREMLRAEPQKAGEQSVAWDGLDMEGKPAPAGTYEWRVLETAGLRSEYLMSVGTSVGSGWWTGNHGGPAFVAVEADSFVTAASSEGPPEILRCSFDGRVMWERASFEPARNPRDVAIGGGKVFYLQDNGKIHVLDFDTGESVGKPLPGLFPVRQVKTPELVGESNETKTFSMDVPNGEYFLRFNYGDGAKATTLVEVHPNGMEPSPGHRTLADKMMWWQLPAAAAGAAKPIFIPQIYQNPRSVPVKDGKLRVEFIPQGKPGQNVYWRVNEIEVLALADRIAAAGDQLVLSCSGAGAVMWLDPKSGEVRDTAKVADVRDIAIGADGAVLALTGDGVVEFSRAAKTPVSVIRGLVAPIALAVDGSSGEILVAEGGQSSQVKRFDKTGKPTATFGRAGGRLTGAYEPKDFAGVSGVAPDGHGGFLVSEQTSAPRRVARFDREGAPVREWFGGMGFYVHTSLDPLDPTIGWMRPQERMWIIKVKMDYERREWRPIACYRWEEMLDEGFFQRNAEYTHIRCLRRDINGDGQAETLLWCQAVPGLVLVEDEAGRRLRPLAAMGAVDAELTDAQKPVAVEKLPAAWAGAIRRAGGDPADVKSRVKFSRYSWADANGDGVMQAEELQLGAGRDARCVRVDDDLTLWQGGAHTGQSGIFTRYKPVRFTACGAPVWDFASAQVGPKTAGDGETASIARSAGGDTFVLLRNGGDGTRAQGMYVDVETHGWAWPAILSDASSLMRLDARDQTVWRSGPKAARWPHPRGQLMSPRNINGFVKGCVAVGDQVEQPCEFWTEDGLYVGGLFDGRDGKDGSLPGGRPDRLYTWIGTKVKRIGQNGFADHSVFAADDMLMGGAVAEVADGSVIFIGHGGNNNPCYRITGWEGWQRMSGSITVTQPAAGASGAGTGLSAEYFANADLSGTAMPRTEGPIWFSPQKQKPWPKEIPEKDFSARWSGFIEPRFSESYTFSVYARGEFRLWIDGQEVRWAAQDYPNERIVRKGHSVPIALRAGKRVAVRLEFRATMPQPVVHLNWESLGQAVEHVPAAFLYPAGKP